MQRPRNKPPGRRPSVPRSGKHLTRESRPAAAPEPVAHQRSLIRVCGIAAVEALFACDAGRIERLYFAAELKDRLTRLCRTLAQARKPYRQLDADALTRVAGTILHGHVVAVARPPPVALFDAAAATEWARDGRLLLILDGIGNPHNLGAIARSAAFFGVARLLLADRPEQAQPSDASYRVAEGGLEHLRLYRARLADAVPALKSAYRVIGTAPAGGAPVPARTGKRPVALILGGEETGLDAATLALCDEIVAIPGSGRVQSLNVAAAAAILIYAVSSRSADARWPASRRSNSASRAADASGVRSQWRSSSAAASKVDSASRRGSRRNLP